MRFGIVLPSYLWADDRRKWAEASLASLSKTQAQGLESKPLLLGIAKGDAASTLLKRANLPQFEVKVVPQPADIRSNDGCLAWGWDQMARTPGITHTLMLADDWLYNPRWLLELRDLIARHPGAKAWWVYRSAYEEIHKTLRIEDDVLVRSINGGGCITVEEWKAWGKDYRKVPRETGEMGNLSLDLLHPQQRPGERWVTKRSYVLNIGMRGACQTPECPDFAVDFVGDGSTERPLGNVVTHGFSEIPATPLPAHTSNGDPFNLTLDLPDGYQLSLHLRRVKNG